MNSSSSSWSRKRVIGFDGIDTTCIAKLMNAVMLDDLIDAGVPSCPIVINATGGPLSSISIDMNYGDDESYHFEFEEEGMVPVCLCMATYATQPKFKRIDMLGGLNFSQHLTLVHMAADNDDICQQEEHERLRHECDVVVFAVDANEPPAKYVQYVYQLMMEYAEDVQFCICFVGRMMSEEVPRFRELAERYVHNYNAEDTRFDPIPYYVIDGFDAEYDRFKQFLS